MPHDFERRLAALALFAIAASGCDSGSTRGHQSRTTVDPPGASTAPDASPASSAPPPVAGPAVSAKLDIVYYYLPG